MSGDWPCKDQGTHHAECVPSPSFKLDPAWDARQINPPGSYSLNKQDNDQAKPWDRIEAPTVTRGRMGEEHTHPAFATIQASRVSGQANLFGSNVGHSGFVKVQIQGATMCRDGYSERISGSVDSYAEVWLSEAQWVAFISRMNVGTCTPCTLRHYGGPDGKVFCPQLPDPERTEERMDGRIDELHAAKIAAITEKSQEIESICESLPAKKHAAILDAVGMMTQHLEANHVYAAKTLREFKEKEVTEARVEIDAMLTDAVGRLGLQSLQQLGAVLAADPAAVTALLGQSATQNSTIGLLDAPSD